MLDADVIWDMPDYPDRNVQHIAQHGVTIDEVEEVLSDPEGSTEMSARSGRPITFGETAGGRDLAVVRETVLDDPLTIDPVTAYDAPRPRSKRR